MVLYLIGLGLGEPKDITVRGLEIVKSCSRVYLEEYTSVLMADGGIEALQKFYGRDLIAADRDLVEQRADDILSGADTSDVALLVVGDPFGATTHWDLVLRAKQLGIDTRTIHNASIMNAVACCGLQLYSFGETVSIPLWNDDWKPDSFYDKIVANQERGLHTLCLLDIKVKERTVENMMKDRKIYLPPRFMSISEAVVQLLSVAESRREARKTAIINEDSLCVALARVGADDQKLVTCSLEEIKHIDMGRPLHALVIVGKMHPLEFDAVREHKLPFL